jgi:predicted dehydrogenase
MSDPTSLSRFARHEASSEADSPKAALRIGALGAARITPMALIRPARAVDGVSVASVAARDPERASRFARKHGIAKVAESYQALIDDPEIDAIYNPLPNSLHCEWTIRALDAGKHVLCEKPFASNAIEAQRMADAGEKSGRVLMEAFHWRFHPLAARMREIVRSGVLGRIRRIEASMCVPMPIPGDIRFRHDLAGGALMDVGSYAVNIVRFLAEGEPRVMGVEIKRSSRDVGRFARAELAFSDGRTGRITCSLMSARLLAINARVSGSEGEMRVFNPVAPHIYHHLRILTPERKTTERIRGEATYVHQLRGFAAAVRGEVPVACNAADAVANMRVLDDIYRGGGLSPRGSE